jgi:hypothetical protein
MHSTVTALLSISTAIAEGFNGAKPAKCSVVVALDVSKAFDSVDHTLLIEEICGSDLHSNFVRWLAAYLRDRTVRCSYNGVLSSPRNIHSGVPQGSVLSPALFNFFDSDCPIVAEVQESYADEIYLLESDVKIDIISNKLNADIEEISAWAKRKNLVLAPEKLQVTLFTPHNKEFNCHSQVFIDGVLVPLNKTPLWLGIKQDTKFCMKDQTSHLLDKTNPRVPILTAIGGSTWGSDKETMLLTFNSVVKPVYFYGLVIWVPNSSKTNIDKIQVAQNRCLRICTGCHQATAVDHLYSGYAMQTISC